MFCPNFSLCRNLYGLTLAVECRSSETARKDNSCVYTTVYIDGGGQHDTGCGNDKLFQLYRSGRGSSTLAVKINNNNMMIRKHFLTQSHYFPVQLRTGYGLSRSSPGRAPVVAGSAPVKAGSVPA
ncbi:hypothetical protein DPMN_053917 [Dreissena polymorpha]|uniref:Uncharacterized protein n=1 Tax=Dreissena polymorpha TaxID=45954 RepID=A0A9D4CPQ8_DREPO|nr:hypothetical protein DPMN_053917 [Dreissena polymorpha]